MPGFKSVGKWAGGGGGGVESVNNQNSSLPLAYYPPSNFGKVHVDRMKTLFSKTIHHNF